MNVDGDNGFSGRVEIDEIYIGSYQKTKSGQLQNRNKTVVFGMAERGSNIMSHVVQMLRLNLDSTC